MTNDIRPVCVVGGGRMGAGISQVFALAGFTVFVYEVNEQVRTSVVDRVRESLACAELDVAVADRIIITDDLSAAVADACFVTEAVGEKLELKREVLAGIAAAAPHDAILASNTSVIPISEIAAGSPAIDRIVGTHWWNPAPLIPLVEVVQATGTSVETVSRTMKLLAAIGKKPMHVRKEVPGFVGNRLQHALWREAIALVQEGVCDATTVDDVVKNSFGLRLAVLGPLENADLVGLDLTLDIHRVVVPALDCQGGPNPVLVDKVARGMLGCKTGEGFRRWSPVDIAEMNNRLEGHLVRLLHPRNTGPVG
ncbi:3-hydroxyacyl-CoA dehydrogenase family protein [Mycobacteroides abscessus]|uniref:3-hydroxyacyl-CoA dehydrogenase family protein n=1 Tax=Mycobacteroides abscessus TaxID=36809 RepID=UPI0019D2C9B2|nr:3-hydroxyacyl-CoA dehydrogenase NAD-binding domain-containing protein [Mycobacteroides abscessus]MBN7361060.1 3-hydroxyacyl-CoA dehydrogenase family protein [Mycobacteroides abscessus subsp. abscessus]